MPNNPSDHRRSVASETRLSSPGGGPPASSVTGAELFADFLRSSGETGAARALRITIARLPHDAPRLWMDCARCMIDGDQPTAAVHVLEMAMLRFPDTLDLRFLRAMALWHTDRIEEAETGLRAIIAEQPAHHDAARQLAHLLRGQGRMEAATTVMEALHQASNTDAARLECIRFIEGCQRQRRAAALIEDDLAGGSRDAAVLAVAGQLAQQVGRFDDARAHFLAALQAGIDLNTWFIAPALADTQRYVSLDHPDFALFERLLKLPGLEPRADAATRFALAKAFDDAGEYARAAAAMRDANALLGTAFAWSRARWRADVEATIQHTWPVSAARARPAFTPIFIVGLPRTGTTLLAELLGRHPQIRNRSELPTMPFVAQGLAASARFDVDALDEARTLYSMHLRQDDEPALAYIDKNPLNFCHIGLIAALFPDACVIHCRRDIRDTALSLWSRSFANEDYGFTCSLGDIAAFAAGHDALMAHWRSVLPQRIVDAGYEDLVADPSGTLRRIIAEAALPAFEPMAMASREDSVIATTSWWQARQPIYPRSIGRWKLYSKFVPELVDAFAAFDARAVG